jgi:hypothetical protein
MFSHLAVILILAGADPAEKVPAPYHDLAEQLVESLRNGDSVGYALCWLPLRRIEAIASASKRPIPTDQLKAMRAYFQKRNHQVARSFNVLSDLFRKQGKIEDLRLIDVNIQGNVKERDGLRHITMFYVTVALGEAQYKITIDDGLEDGGAWFFSDRPLHVEGGPDSESISFAENEESGITER